MPDPKTALVTGASNGIGAAYAERLAGRGYDLVLVARDTARMEDLAERLRASNGISIDIIGADLTASQDLARVEQRLRDDARIKILVNNAGAALQGGYSNPDLDAQQTLIALNVTAVARLAGAVIPAFLARSGGAIINVSSVLAVAPQLAAGIYPATKAFVLAFSQSLQAELGAKSVYVQAVLPAATRTRMWERPGRKLEEIEGLMDAGEMVDAALVGFDRREGVTLPSLPNEADWDAFEAARRVLIANFAQEHAAARYRP